MPSSKRLFRRTFSAVNITGPLSLKVRSLCAGLIIGMKELIVIRRFENISLHSVMKDIRVRPEHYQTNREITDIPWLAPAKTPPTTKLSRSDFNKRTELFSEFLYWLFDSLIIHLVRTNFYVTETAVHRNRVFYFRHDIWRQISAPSITNLKHAMLAPITKVPLH